MRIQRTNFSPASFDELAAQEPSIDGFVQAANTTLDPFDDVPLAYTEQTANDDGLSMDDLAATSGFSAEETVWTQVEAPEPRPSGRNRFRSPILRASDPAGLADGSFDSHFLLAPNVRFTRTPDRDPSQRRPYPEPGQEPLFLELPHAADIACEAEIPGVIADAAEMPPVEIHTQAPQPEPVAPEPVAIVETPMPASDMFQAASAMPEAAAAPAPQEDTISIIQRLREALEEHYRQAPVKPVEMMQSAVALSFGANSNLSAPAAPVAPTLRIVETAPLPELKAAPAQADVIVRDAGPFAHLSDFAFWETIGVDDDSDDDVQAEPVAVKPAPRFVPTPRLSRPLPPAQSIETMFRVVDVRKPEPARETKPVSTDTAPVAATPVAVTVTAPVVENIIPPAPVAPVPVIKAPVAQIEETVVEPPAAVVEPRETTSRGIAISKPFQIDSHTRATVVHAGYTFPPRELLQQPTGMQAFVMSQEQLEQNAGLLESVLEDFGVRGEIIHVRPGPVVTLYEFEPAPGVKSSRVINLADDIARSMSALSARVAVVPGRNVIGIELPNAIRETVYFREMIESQDFARTGFKLPLCLGKTIGGEPVIAELAKMPHLLVAGTTGSGKSVAINTMILSLLYRLKPEECRLIMVDPKMLELSVYDGIPHLLTPVVTDPKKAVMALKWAVREMEDRYRKMSRLSVRNIDGYNARAALARDKGETVTHVVQTGFDKGTGEAVHQEQELDLSPMPYIVIIVDEMADLMMVAGKEIEGAIQRLAQMARAAGIHLIMATQRPSVDVITGTIKANFPTRISFQVTSKIDSRTILGEQGAEQLLGQGDMLHMIGGGRVARVHGPFVSDEEVEKVVAHLKTQGRPEYLDTVTADEETEEEEEPAGAVFDKGDMAAEDGNDLYDKAVKVVLRDKKCSTSYIQRRLGIGYNRAASLVERMEKEGLVGQANHVGKREIINGNRDAPIAPQPDEE